MSIICKERKIAELHRSGCLATVRLCALSYLCVKCISVASICNYYYYIFAQPTINCACCFLLFSFLYHFFFSTFGFLFCCCCGVELFTVFLWLHADSISTSKSEKRKGDAHFYNVYALLMQ